MPINLKRMLQIIDEVFETRNDSSQLQVDEADMKQLRAIHASTLHEVSNEDGPTTWVLMIPTTTACMHSFLKGEISETELLHNTPVPGEYDALYLCSASTLPEFRGKQQTFQACLLSIESIRNDHPIQTLFVWPFSAEGRCLAQKLSQLTGLPLLEKE